MDANQRHSSHGTPMTPVAIRAAINNALKESVKAFRAELESESTTKDNGSVLIEKSRWILDAGESSISDLNYFWRNMSHYTELEDPEYLNISIISLRNCALDRGGSRATSLEQLWKWLEDSREIYYHGLLIVCTDRTDTEQISKGNNPVYSFINSAPNLKSICKSALVTSLFLLKNRFGFGMSDMHSLTAAALGGESTEDKSLLGDVPQEDLYPAVLKEGDPPLSATATRQAGWHSVKSNSILPKSLTKSATKTITFPGVFPHFKTTWQYMDIYQPHGFVPNSRSVCGVWGNWNTDYTSWTCVTTIREPRMADEFLKGLLDVFSVASPAILSVLSSHWTELTHYLYAIGLNDARLVLRDALKAIHTIKYKNASNPTTGSAHVCLMYMNHLEYHQRLLDRLEQEFETFPPLWRIVSTPAWPDGMVKTCRYLKEDLVKALAETTQVRNMIIQQYSLSQSRKTGVLTILASIFVPMSFVATFFGMNTKEINNSAWPLNYYIIAAISLTAVTVFVPLLGLQLFSQTARVLGSNTSLRRAIKWGCILLSFVMNLINDILLTTLPSSMSIGSFYVSTLVFCALITTTYIISLYGEIRQQESPKLTYLWRQKERVSFYCFTVICFCISWYVQQYVELAPYFLYLIKRGYRLLRKNRV